MWKKKVLREVLCLLTCLGLVLGFAACGLKTGTGLQGRDEGNAERERSSQEEKGAEEDGLSAGEGKEDAESSEEKKQNKGVYYEKIDRKLVRGKYNPTACYAYPAFCFREAIYTGSDVFTWECGSKEEKEMKEYEEEYLGEKIGKAYGNHEHYWSDARSDLQEVTESSGIYRVKGFSDKNRVCLFYKSAGEEESDYYVMQMFDCLNGIYLEYGRELFKERLCMDNFDIAIEESGEKWDKKRVRKWREKLYQGKFVRDEVGRIAERIAEQERYVSFSDGLGLSVELCLGDQGEVLFSRGGNQFVLELK